MSQTFNSKNEPIWLKESHQRRKSRSVELGKQSIDQLIKQGDPITYTTITEQSKEIDPERKGIHPNTIRSNEHLYEYYKQHSKTHKQKKNSKNNTFKRSIPPEDIEFHKIKLNRNLDNLRRKYMKLTKEELVQRLILAEEYIAENNTKWVSSYFESFK
ncbi:hypothetical protein P9Z76_20520 [Bacillus cereus]|uniref:hypothetical protein n=1 Tax=Bacillus thuringiensis TaxID=1428 RepID=UPI0018CFA8C6|nr:hypothetical protein [Bacillus thuringiensis]MEB9531132.1 hypothetical protein [Bacillus cereus]MBG9707516.1 hypothetical protein [Bacillus thuringiensis]MEB9725452.1 hypothetical protein [Bacillus cereus]MEC2944432.1 hypothetical protein [Bacillus cereus]MEC3175848.1 hypothetical protein [Bacillus cereus]